MTSDHIKITAKLRSVSKAAEKLSISQPALSAHIKKIEEENGIIIFDRTRKPLTLTEQGRVYLKYSEKKDALEKELKKEISDLNGLKTGDLVIGGASAFNSIYLPRAVKLFAQKYPGIKTVIIDDRVPEIERRTLEGEIDLFLTPPRISHREIMSEVLFDDRILLRRYIFSFRSQEFLILKRRKYYEKLDCYRPTLCNWPSRNNLLDYGINCGSHVRRLRIIHKRNIPHTAG